MRISNYASSSSILNNDSKKKNSLKTQYTTYMPVYLHIFNLIIDKASISRKYKGGLVQFKKDFVIEHSEINQEDDDLISFGGMNLEDLPIDDLIAKGIDFDQASQFSEDFAIVYRYGGDFWKVDWLTDNSVFAWHKNTDQSQVELVHKIGKMTMDEIESYRVQGINYFSTIRKRND
jgi:hypothetical protein